MDSENYKSRTKLKVEAKALQKLGESLTEMSENILRDLSLPDDLYRALIDAKSMKKHEAKRRQLQYIGSLMRRLDAASIRQLASNIQHEIGENKPLVSSPVLLEYLKNLTDPVPDENIIE